MSFGSWVFYGTSEIGGSNDNFLNSNKLVSISEFSKKIALNDSSGMFERKYQTATDSRACLALWLCKADREGFLLPDQQSRK